MKFLNSLLARLADIAVEDQPNAIQQALTETQGLNPSELSQGILEMFDELTAGDSPATDETLQKLELLAHIADGVQVLAAEAEERNQRAREIGERLRNQAAPGEAEEDEEGPVTAPSDENEGPQPEGANPAAPESETTIDTSAVSEEGGAAAAPGAEVEPAAAPDPAAPALPEPVAAAVRPAPRVPLGTSNTAPPARQSTQRSSFEKFSLIAAADVPGFSTGQVMENGLADFAEAWESRILPLVSAGVNSGEDGRRTRVGVARIKRTVPEAFTITNENEAAHKIEAACDERNLPGGSLVAAAGWCAPSETLYDLCPIRITAEGMISLPSIVARRGGVRYPAPFDWAAAWGSVGFHLSETQVIAGAEKPCIEVPCPTDFEECRMDVSGLCIRTPILMERGWPERVQQFMEGALLIHQHRLNARKLARMEELSTRIVIPAPDPTNVNATITDPHGPGAIESLLSVLELQVQYQRYHWRLSQADTLEMVAPYWLRGILKSDLRKKLGVDNRWDITDATLDSYLRNVGVNPQWVYDWQDSFSEPLDPAGFGGQIPTTWPTKVKVMLYPAGTFFQLQADVINLDGIYDHASLVQNIYTSLFTEEGWQVCARCLQSYVLEIGLCASGLSGSHQSVQCCEPPAAELPAA